MRNEVTLKIILFKILALFILINYGFSQQYSLKVTMQNLPNKKISLTKVHGDTYSIIDSAHSDNNSFLFKFSPNMPVGVYKLILGKTERSQFMGGPPQALNIIFNKENIELRSDFFAPVDSLEIITSKENKVYYDFLKRNNEYEQKKQLLYPLLFHYPDNDEFFNEVIRKYDQLQTEQANFIEKTITQNPQTFAARIIKMFRAPYVEATLSEPEHLKYLKEHYFDHLDFSDENLLNSSIYADKVIGYLSLYRNPNLHQSDQEDEFIKAVDVVMKNTNQNSRVYEFVLDYLVRGYERFNFEKVLNHISENYVDTSCETENKSLLEKRLAAYKKMALGNTVPEIIIEDIDGNITALSEIANEYVLVLFWASSCPHCTSMLAKLKKWYENEREIDLEVFAISIDTSKTEWDKVVQSEQLPWINCSNLKGWNGTTARDYNIYATPTMFILDRKRTILAKPVTFAELKREFRKLRGK